MGLFGMLFFVVLGEKGKLGFYELIYGFVFDIVGCGVVNLLVVILLFEMVLCWLFGWVEMVDWLFGVVMCVFDGGVWICDIGGMLMIV